MRSFTKQLLKLALAEDIGGGDVTTIAILPKSLKATAEIKAKQDLILAGIDIAKQVFKKLNRSTSFTSFKKDGSFCKKGETLAIVKGPASVLLSGERTALNFLQHLSGIATHTRAFVNAVKGTKAKILDTRKTLPAWRVLEKYAVKAGGGTNHRRGLFDHYLIKNNHITVAGSITRAVALAKKKRKKGQWIEVETRTLTDVREALGAGADIIMLDNMTPAMMKKAVKLIGSRAKIEASGNVSLSNVKNIARTGVNFISVGALTHSAAAVDINMVIKLAQMPITGGVAGFSLRKLITTIGAR